MDCFWRSPGRLTRANDVRYFRSGLYKAPAYPWVAGQEAAGTVVAVHPSVTGFKVGDRVVYMHTSTYAKFTSVPSAKTILHIPDGVDLETAAASVLQGLTALTLIREAGEISPGPAGPNRPWVLVHAGAGGTGGLMVQILHTFGANVIATAGNAEKCAVAKKNGADAVINTQEEDLVARVKDITGGKGVNVILMALGRPPSRPMSRWLRGKGTIVSFGNAVCPSPELGTVHLRVTCSRIAVLLVRRSTARRHPPAGAQEHQARAPGCR